MATQTPEELAAAKAAAEAKKAAAKAENTSIAQQAKTHRQLTKDFLDKQPKVTLMLELREGEPKEEIVGINDVMFHIPRGKEVEVPLNVANIIREKMRAEGKLGQISKEMMANMAKAEAQAQESGE